MSRTVTAPGKILLAGEYAILDGFEAVIAAVERRVAATVVDEAQELSPFLEAARRRVAAHFGARSPQAESAARVVVDSSALYSGSLKLGLGSSAAVTVAAVGAAMSARGQSIDRALVHRLAHRAHGDAQEAMGSRGSGADVAASVHGGVLGVRSLEDRLAPLAVRPVPLPSELVLMAVWTGQPAATPELVARVRALKARERVGYDRLIGDVGQAAADLMAACRAGDAGAAVTAIDRAGRAAAALGEAAGIHIETPAHRRLADWCAACGGAAKPVGAGGGDLALLAFSRVAAAEELRERVISAGQRVLPFEIDWRGVQ